MKDSVLCIDIGSTSLKAALMNEAGKTEGFVRVEFKNSVQDAGREWVSALAKAVKLLKEENGGNALQIEAVCISGNGPTLCSTDGTTLLWNQKVDEKYLTETKSLFIPRLKGFRDAFPDKWEETNAVFSGPEYLIWRLTGSPCTILPEERFRETYWTQEELEKCGFTEEEIKKLPPFIGIAQCAGKITQAAALETGLLEGTMVVTGGPDFIVALIGTNTLEEGFMCDRAGSSEGINLCTSQPLYGDKIRTLPSVIPGLWNASVLISESGVRLEDYKKQLETRLEHSVSWDELYNLVLDNPKDYSDGYEILRDMAIKVFAAGNILNKAVKAASLPDPKYITVTGGQALNSRWTQFKCDTMGIPMRVTDFPDAELVGDHILARLALGDFDSLEEAAFTLVKTTNRFSPATPQDHK